MPRYRVAVERTYKDVAVVWIEAHDKRDAKTQALEEARDEPPAKDFGTACKQAVIECEVA